MKTEVEEIMAFFFISKVSSVRRSIFYLFFEYNVSQIRRGGHRSQLKNCMSLMSYPKEFPLILKYLLYLAALFHRQPINLHHQYVCSNHLKCLTSAEKRRCHVCKPLRQQDTVDCIDVRPISKPLTVGIWEENRLLHSWATYG